MIILGLDASLTAFGRAVIDTELREFRVTTFKPKIKGDVERGHPRLEWLLEQLRPDMAAAAMAVIEGPAYGAQGSATDQLAGLRWHVRHEMWKLGLQYVIVQPGTLKLYATGNGGCNKDEIMLRTGRAFPTFQGDNNAADALWLAHMGADHVGQPLVDDLTKKQRGALRTFALGKDAV